MMSSAEDSIHIVLNGEPRTLATGSRLTELLALLGRDPRTVAVEHNGKILPRARYEETELADGDRVEVVHFVQGG